MTRWTTLPPALGHKKWLFIFSYFILISIEVNSEIYLEPLDTLYLPYSFDPIPQYGLGRDAAEQCAYDNNRHLIFAVGSTFVHTINATDPRSLNLLTSYAVGHDAEMTDIEVCGEYIFVSVDNLTAHENGFVLIFTFDEINTELELVHKIIVGDLPDMVLPSKDCNTAFVALEAEAYVDVDDRIIDPEAGFGIIRWDSTNPANQPSYRVVDFRKFNNRVAEYVEKGVRFVYRNNENTFAQDLEPEYITLNEDETLAYVCLQENSAIAVVDIANLDTADIIDIHPLVSKNWMESSLDPSDRDDGVNMKPWPVYGSHQPDAIKYFLHQGEGYILTANEGDSKVYSSTTETLFTEESRGKNFVSEGLISPDIQPDDVTGYLNNDAQLGRLKMSLSSGMVNDTGKYNQFFSFGGRSFSIIRASDMKMVYDSQDDVEKSIAEFYPQLFNSNAGDPLLTPREASDSRSDDKGPESESITYGNVWNKTLIFMGNERPGTISIYSMTEESMIPRFESIFFGGELVDGRTWQEMFDKRSVGDLDPEDVIFIAPDDSSTGEPMLLVSGDVSGTISMYAVRMREITDVPSTEIPRGGTTGLVSFHVTMVYIMHMAVISVVLYQYLMN